jgi:hypothetical protein
MGGTARKCHAAARKVPDDLTRVIQLRRRFAL